jgi:hypothetical protein
MSAKKLPKKETPARTANATKSNRLLNLVAALKNFLSKGGALRKF